MGNTNKKVNPYLDKEIETKPLKSILKKNSKYIDEKEIKRLKSQITFLERAYIEHLELINKAYQEVKVDLEVDYFILLLNSPYEEREKILKNKNKDISKEFLKYYNNKASLYHDYQSRKKGLQLNLGLRPKFNPTT